MAEEKITKKERIIKPKSKIWIEGPGGVIFGGGREELFMAVDELGSIRQAATKLGMSYRAAWGKIKATEERFGRTLIIKRAGGPQGGAELTEEAKQLLESYQEFKSASVKAVNELFQKYFSHLSSTKE